MPGFNLPKQRKLMGGGGRSLMRDRRTIQSFEPDAFTLARTCAARYRRLAASEKDHCMIRLFQGNALRLEAMAARFKRDAMKEGRRQERL
jgi:hypothetical protein